MPPRRDANYNDDAQGIPSPGALELMNDSVTVPTNRLEVFDPVGPAVRTGFSMV